MKKTSIGVGAAALIAAFAPLWAEADIGLMGGRGKFVPPGLSEPSFPSDDAQRNPFAAPRPGSVRPSGENGSKATEGGMAPADAVEAAIAVQGVFLVQGKPSAFVNGQKVCPLDKLKIMVKGKMEEVNVVEINKVNNSVRLEYKGREFVRTMGGAKMKRP